MSELTDKPVAEADPTQAHEEAAAGGARTSAPRRRRRGGRGRGRSAAAKPGEGGATSEAADAGAEAAERPAQEKARVKTAARATSRRSPGPRPKPTGKAAPSQAETGEQPAGETSEAEPAARRRRRRGGRGRGRKPAGTSEGVPATEGSGEPTSPAAATDEAEGEAAPEAKTKSRSGRRRRLPAKKPKPEMPSVEEAAQTPPEGEAGDGKPARKRSRRRKKASTESEKAEAPAAEAPKARSRAAKPKTPARASARASKAEAVGTKGSTRLHRRTGTRRPRQPLPVIRHVQDKVMVLTENGDRDQIAVLENRELVQHFVTRMGAKSMVGNVYLGRVQNVLPGMEAAFVDVGRGRNAVLYAGEVNYSDEDLEGAAPRIEHVLKSGQSVLVQVTKDPIGGKGPRLTAQVSLPGRYLVLVPNTDVSGISRRLPDDERKRLKAIVKKVKPEGHGLIVRTAADGASEEALGADVQRLLDTWADIEKRSKKVKAPHVLYEEPELTVRVVRDLFTDGEYREVVTDSTRIHEEITTYLRDVAPDLLEKVNLHQGKLPAFEEFHVIEQIHKGLDRKVWLSSGGYLIIERTEAMTVIDVNTGKHVGKSNLEETVVKTNLEAALEVARQLRLRDIGGIIIIDFIDMLLEKNKEKVVETLREEMAQDKTRSQVFEIGALGLLEVTRKRVSAGLLESFSETCPTCEGRGILLTHDI